MRCRTPSWSPSTTSRTPVRSSTRPGPPLATPYESTDWPSRSATPGTSTARPVPPPSPRPPPTPAPWRPRPTGHSEESARSVTPPPDRVRISAALRSTARWPASLHRRFPWSRALSRPAPRSPWCTWWCRNRGDGGPGMVHGGAHEAVELDSYLGDDLSRRAVLGPRVAGAGPEIDGVGISLLQRGTTQGPGCIVDLRVGRWSIGMCTHEPVDQPTGPPP